MIFKSNNQYIIDEPNLYAAKNITLRMRENMTPFRNNRLSTIYRSFFLQAERSLEHKYTYIYFFVYVHPDRC